MRNTAGLRKGNPGNKGGGQKPWAWREEMRRALQEGDAPKVVQRIISGDIQEEIARDKNGEPIYGETKNADRLKAIQIAASYAEGMPVQPTRDDTPREPAQIAASQLLEAIPRLLSVLPPLTGDQAKMLEAVEADWEIVK